MLFSKIKNTIPHNSEDQFKHLHYFTIKIISMWN